MARTAGTGPLVTSAQALCLLGANGLRMVGNIADLVLGSVHGLVTSRRMRSVTSRSPWHSSQLQAGAVGQQPDRRMSPRRWVGRDGECHSFGWCLVLKESTTERERSCESSFTGATGALGRPLVPMLVAAGQEVTATTRTPGKVAQLREAGARPVVLDGLDREAVIAAVQAAAPEVIVHQMTSLAGMRSLRKVDQVFAATNKLRTRGTDNLLAPAARAGTRRVIAQSAERGNERSGGGEDRGRSARLDARPVVGADDGGSQACGEDGAANVRTRRRRRCGPGGPRCRQSRQARPYRTGV